MSKNELFLELAKPDEKGVSRWVSVREFTGKYAKLQFGNGADWARKESSLAKKYNIELDKTKTPGNRIDRVRLIGFNTEEQFQQSIRKDIKEKLGKQRCVMLGIYGASNANANTHIEIDHKNGRKNDMRVSNLKTQKLEDFQPLCKVANDIKRQICKECEETNIRWDAKNLLGNPYSFYKGNSKYTAKLGCVGCYQYDPVAYRIECTKKICEEATKNTVEFIMNKLYSKNNN